MTLCWEHKREDIHLQWIIASSCKSPTKEPQYFVLMIREADGSEAKVWSSQVLNLFCQGARRDIEETMISLHQFLEVASPWDEVNWTSCCFIVGWSPYNCEDFSVNKKSPTKQVLKVVERYDMAQLELFMCIALRVWGNTSVHSFTGNSLWSHYRFPVNSFYNHCKAQCSKDEVENTN